MNLKSLNSMNFFQTKLKESYVDNSAPYTPFERIHGCVGNLESRINKVACLLLLAIENYF